MTRKRKQSNELTPPFATLPILPIVQSKWQNWWTRTLTTVLLISGFTAILLLGHPFLIVLIILIQIQIYKEVISIASYPSKQKDLPFFQSMSWYFLLSTNYFLYGESAIWYFKQHVLAGNHLASLSFFFNPSYPSFHLVHSIFLVSLPHTSYVLPHDMYYLMIRITS